MKHPHFTHGHKNRHPFPQPCAYCISYDDIFPRTEQPRCDTASSIVKNAADAKGLATEPNKPLMRKAESQLNASAVGLEEAIIYAHDCGVGSQFTLSGVVATNVEAYDETLTRDAPAQFTLRTRIITAVAVGLAIIGLAILIAP